MEIAFPCAIPTRVLSLMPAKTSNTDGFCSIRTATSSCSEIRGLLNHLKIRTISKKNSPFFVFIMVVFFMLKLCCTYDFSLTNPYYHAIFNTGAESLGRSGIVPLGLQGLGFYRKAEICNCGAIRAPGEHISAFLF